MAGGGLTEAKRPSVAMALAVCVLLATAWSVAKSAGGGGENADELSHSASRIAIAVGAPPQPLMQRARVVLVTMEYRHATFSGNGIYAMAQARALAGLGHEVLVVCGDPTVGAAVATGARAPVALQPGITELAVAVPSAKWGSLGSQSPWAEFRDAVSRLAAHGDHVAAFDPQVILGVDWHGMAAVATFGGGVRSAAHVVLLSYRCFSRSGGTADELALYRQQERRAAELAALTIVLADDDAAAMKGLGARATAVLLPPLRKEIHGLAAAAAARGVQPAARARKYLTCCVRLSKEKSPHLFADVVFILRDFLQKHNIAPLLCAPDASAAADGDRREYRERVIERFKAAQVPGARLVTRFMGPVELASVLSDTLLNIHPPTYDAFGMSVVEAASFGAPSLLHSTGGGVSVGAAALLQAARGESLAADFSQGADVAAARVRGALLDAELLAAVGARARVRALSWDEAANAKRLVALVGELVFT